MSVTDRSILGLSPVWSAIRYISEAIAALKSDVFVMKDGNTLPAFGHPVFNLFSGRVHPLYTKFDFLQALMANACLGDGYARIHWDAETMRPVMLEHLPRELVYPELSPSGQLFYRVQGVINTFGYTSGGQMVNLLLPDTDVIHIKGITFNGVTGERVVLRHKTNFSGGLAALEYTDAYFGNGAHTDKYATQPNSLTPDQYNRLRARMQRDNAGVKKAGEIMVLDNGMEIKNMQNNPEEAGLMDFRRLTVEEVSRIFKVPLHLLSQLERSTFSNMEQQSFDFVQHTLMPWVEKLEQEFTSKLFTAFEVRTRRYCFAFNLDSMQRADAEGRSKLYSSALQHGWMTPNEVRAKEGLNPIEGGDRLFVQLNMAPMDKIEEIHMAKTGGSDAPADAQSDEDNAGSIAAAA